MDRVLRYLESNTPTKVVDKRNGKVITDYANMDTNAQLERGTFRLASYEWGGYLFGHAGCRRSYG